MDKNVAEHVAEVLKAVAHPVRLQIVELLETKEMCVGDIVMALGGKQAITSQQLNICLLYTSPSPRDRQRSRMPSSA